MHSGSDSRQSAPSTEHRGGEQPKDRRIYQMLSERSSHWRTEKEGATRSGSATSPIHQASPVFAVLAPIWQFALDYLLSKRRVLQIAAFKVAIAKPKEGESQQKLRKLRSSDSCA
ncbi:unnamed protein product [Effrenium voratum]|nr:unnamed protein product [Effrenium voratum]